MHDLQRCSQSVDDVSYTVAQTFFSEKRAAMLVAYPVFLIRLMHSLLFEKPAVAHINLSSGGSIYRKTLAAHILVWFNVPYVIHLHGSTFDVGWKKIPRQMRDRVSKALKCAARVVALSDTWSEWLRTEIGLNNVAVIRNGTRDLGTLAARRSPKKTVFLFAGRLGERKGVDTLIAAMELIENRDGIELWLAGDGELQSFKRQVSKLGLSENVLFFGWVAGEELDDLFAQASVFVLPSRHEGMPLSIIEAMSAGLPIVCTNVGGIPELVENGNNGIVVEPGDAQSLAKAMEILCADPTTRQHLGKNSRFRYLSGFSADRMFLEFRELYFQVCAGK